MSSVERPDPGSRPAGLRIIAQGKPPRYLGSPNPERETRVAAVSAAADRAIDHARQNGQLPAPVRRLGMPGPNEHLAQALADAGLTPAELAKKVHVNAQTVERWLTNGRVPFRTHQVAVSQVVGARVSQLWPDQNRPTPRAVEENARLREAVFDARLTPAQVAEKLEVDPKTVDRWIREGRVPFPRHRAALALMVDVPEQQLWPAPARPHVLAQEHPERTAEPAPLPPQQPSIERDEQPDRGVSPRIRACMSWVDTTRTPDRPTTPPAAPVRRNYSRSYGVERSR